VTVLMMLMLTGVLMLTGGDNYSVDEDDAYRYVDTNR